MMVIRKNTFDTERIEVMNKEPPLRKLRGIHPQ
jgi:hypothetical protein